MIRQRTPDKFKAKSMIEAAELEMNFIKTLKPSRESGATMIKGIYESFRKLGEALMLIRGKEPVGLGQHNTTINELILLNASTKRPIQVLNILKKTRNDVNYEGYIPSIEEIEDALSISEACFKPILERIKEELNKL